MSINNQPKAYACYNLDEETRKQSSSGGIFTLLASTIIAQGGVVYGAAFNQEYLVEHIRVDNKEDLSKLRGSKYVQSKLGNTYSEIKELLEQDKLVYFSGTPCQIDGLLCFLNKKYDNLICQDIVCHGVPSPKVWKHYLDYQNNKFKGVPKKIKFRNKDFGWDNYDMYIKYENDIYQKIHRDDYFMKVFLSNLCLRPSCYDCHSKSLNRNSDITLADFWGIKDVCSEMYDDNKGTSLIFVNSVNGEKLFNEIINNVKYQEIDINKASQYNPAAFKSVLLPEKRDKYLIGVFNNDFNKYAKKFTKLPFKLRLKIHIARLIKR